MKHYVEIVNLDTGEVVKRMGPMTHDEAGRVYAGWTVTLGEGYYLRFAEEEEEA